VDVRDRIDGRVGSMPIDQAIARLQTEASERRVRHIVKSDFSAAFQGEGDERNEY
jgi:threonyl-tRNA synthetase